MFTTLCIWLLHDRKKSKYFNMFNFFHKPMNMGGKSIEMKTFSILDYVDVTFYIPQNIRISGFLKKKMAMTGKKQSTSMLDYMDMWKHFKLGNILEVFQVGAQC